jgi:signal transduction histidine kinase
VLSGKHPQEASWAFHMNKKTAVSKIDNTILKLKVSAKKKEDVRDKLVVTAKQLATTAKEKESVRRKLLVTARALRLKAKQLAVTAKEKEDTRDKLAVTAKQLAVTAREKEIVRRKLEVTAKQLAITAKERETVRDKLVVTAKQLATTAKEKESVRRKLLVTARALRLKAKQLAVTAKEKESIRGRLAVTAETLRLKAKQLAVTAKEKEDTRDKLAVTAKQLAVTAKEKEIVRRKLLVTAKNLDIKAKQLAVTAKKVELANKELRSLDLAKDEFVSIASHQLRTPLTALKGYTGMLIDGDAGPLNDKQREYLTEIKNANDRMINLITALLNVSRVDLGVFIVEPEQVNLENIAEGALKDLELNINEKKLLVNKSFEKDLPPIRADLNIIRMIFQNLFSNAVKYTPPAGSITLTIKRDKSNILISVADTGYGIPKNSQSKIFTKMFRADNARVKDPDGTGLGLYIIKETIEKTGGKIWFESTENKGSTFYVAIPLGGMKKKEGSRRLELK